MSLFVEPRERMDCFVACDPRNDGALRKKAPANREGLSVTSIFAIQIGCAPAVSKTPPFLPLSSWAVVWVGRVSLQTSVEPPVMQARAAGPLSRAIGAFLRPNIRQKGPRRMPRPSPFRKGSVVSWCRPSWSSCLFRPPSWS